MSLGYADKAAVLAAASRGCSDVCQVLWCQCVCPADSKLPEVNSLFTKFRNIMYAVIPHKQGGSGSRVPLAELSLRTVIAF